MSDPEPLPDLQHPFPVTFRVGSVGAGLGVGCGVGIGFGAPLDLRALPGLGAAAANVTSSLGPLLTWASNASSGLQGAVRGLGIKGLDIGAGCGVGLGYGFGAGLMLRPSAVEQLHRQGQQILGALAARLPWAAQWAQQPPADHHHLLPPAAAPPGLAMVAAAHCTTAGTHSSAPQSPVPAGSVWPSLSSSNHQQLLPPSLLQQSAPGSTVPAAAHPPIDPTLTTTAAQGQSGSPSSPTAATSTPPAAADGGSSPWQALYEQQQQLQRLKQQNRALRAALCRARPKDPICRLGGASSSSRELWSE